MNYNPQKNYVAVIPTEELERKEEIIAKLREENRLLLERIKALPDQGRAE